MLYKLQRWIVSAGGIPVIVASVLLTACTSTNASKMMSFVSGTPSDRVQFRVQQLDNQIGNLLLKIPLGSETSASPAEMEETYRLIIRHLYQSALACKNRILRSMIVLKADQLYAGLADFDQQMAIVLSPGNTNHAGMARACRNFYRASSRVNNPITSIDALHQYLHALLKPLAPLAQVQFIGASAPEVWAVQAASGIARHTETPGALPDISAEISIVKRADVPPEMRSIVQSILQDLRSGIKNPDTRRQSLIYYEIIQQCVNLAVHLQQSTVLPPTTRMQFDHRLMLGLLFFRDPRTRWSASLKLESIRTVVNSLETLQTAPLPPAAQKVISQCMHTTIVQLQSSGHAATHVHDLRLLDQLLIRQRYFAQYLQHDHAAYTNLAWHRISVDGNKDLEQVVTELKNGLSRSAIQTYIRHNIELSNSLIRLAAMRSSARQALLYHPQPADGVDRNMRRWARHIGMHPYKTGKAAKSFDQFNDVLNLLAATHRDMAAQGPQRILHQLSGGRYTLFVAQFLQTQRDVVNALAHPQIVPDSLVRRLQRQRLIFNTSSALAYLLAADHPLLKLNQWAAWHISPQAEKTMLNEFEQTMSFEFLMATSRKPVSSEAWAGFSASAASITHLADACQILLPELKAPPTAWSTGWLQAFSTPPANALFGNDLARFSQACMLFNSAAYHSAHGNEQAAIGLYNSGLNVIREKF